jgi:transcriptional regulator with AAA-type ATPase domain
MPLVAEVSRAIHHAVCENCDDPYNNRRSSSRAERSISSEIRHATQICGAAGGTGVILYGFEWRGMQNPRELWGMPTNRDTTEREQQSDDAVLRSQVWLRWLSPASDAPVALQHGMILGRDAECDVQLGGEGVSRRHMEVHRQGPIFVLRDLASTNGTFLDGKRVQYGPVVPGAVLRVGEHVGIFSECSGTPLPFREIAAGLLGGHELSTALGPLQSAAKSAISIVVVGPTGTGKERVARAIHDFSGRKGRLQALNCAALPRELAEAELFGYRKGAFTGADRASLGHFRAADGGTLFLDEIAELPMALQAKLLRVLEERSVTPLGETEPVPVDVRIVAAVQVPLGALVAAKLFREDFSARLSGLTLRLPPLRERVADVAYLFRHFIDHYSGGRPPKIESKLVECLCLHDWPGNVRELEQLAHQLLVVHGLEPTLKRAFLPAELRSLVASGADSNAPAAPAFSERRDHDARQLALALAQVGGNVTAAAARVGFSRQRAYRLLNGMGAEGFVARELGLAPPHEHVDSSVESS